MRKLSGIISKTNTTAIFINQIREKIGIVFGNPETTTGGRALKFYASVRLEIRKGEALKVGTDIIGYKGKVKVVKNKMAPPFKQVEFDVIFGEGISFTGEILDIGSQYEIIEKAGSWYSYNGERLGQGREKAREALKANPALVKEIADKIYSSINGVPDDFVPEPDEKEELA